MEATMDKIDLVLWVVGGGFTIYFGILISMWGSINSKIDGLDQRLSNKIDKLDEKVTDIDRRICRLEGAFASKDCCMIKDERRLPKAEGS